MKKSDKIQSVKEGNTYLGIELGSTRIKAVLIGKNHEVIASGSHTWENCLENGYWTYPLADVWDGIRDAYAELAEQVNAETELPLTDIGGIGISAMMHGYLPFDKNGEQLAAFRTWRNTTTAEAAEKLSSLFDFNIPQRWSIAHLYQAMLNKEDHVGAIDFLTTLAGYVHWQLTGEKVLGVGEASGMFPIDSNTADYDATMMAKFNELAEKQSSMQSGKLSWKLQDILPKCLKAGAPAGTLTAEGAKLLDPSGLLKAGIPLCPPEGDAGTGMVATNSISPRTGNVSAGTSVFAMVVLEKALANAYPELDMVTTPEGHAVAMVHCNTCTSDLNAWVGLFAEGIETITGKKPDMDQVYEKLYTKALEGKPDCGGMMAINYYAGEPVTGFAEGRPLFVRKPDAGLSVADFMRTQLNASMATLKIGMDLLLEKEGVKVDQLLGHGGLFKTPVVGQKLMAGALNVPVAVMETAGEGGPWGMAILAAYAAHVAKQGAGESLETYLKEQVFKKTRGLRMEPDEADVAGFAAYIENYRSVLEVERAAVEALK